MPDEKEGAVVTAATEPQRVYEIGKGWIDAPPDAKFSNEGPMKPNAAPAPVVEKPKEETPNPNAPPPVKDTPKTDPPPPTAPVFSKEKFEKYGFEKEEDIYTSLDKLDILAKEVEESRKPREMEFKSETHKALFKFLDQLPEQSWNEILKTGGEILAMDPDKADGVKVLREAFIIANPMLPRDVAGELFDDEHSKKYALKDKTQYEDPTQYDKDKRLNEARMQIEVDKARHVLREKKTQLTVEPKSAEPAKKELPQETIQGYTKEIDKVFDGTTKGSGLAYLDKNFIRMRGEEGKDPLINIEIPADKLKELRETAQFHIKNPANYDDKGKLHNFDAAKNTFTLALALWPEWISQQIAKQVDTLANIKKAEQIASADPDKIETTKGKDVKELSVEDQWKILAQREKEFREKNPQRR